jgi:hypothetical protein
VDYDTLISSRNGRRRRLLKLLSHMRIVINSLPTLSFKSDVRLESVFAASVVAGGTARVGDGLGWVCHGGCQIVQSLESLT